MDIERLIRNLTDFADFYERSSAKIERAQPFEQTRLSGYRDLNADYYLRCYQATPGMDRVRAYVLSRYGEELTIGTARRVLGDLIRLHKLTVEAAGALLLEAAMDRLDAPTEADQTNSEGSAAMPELPTEKIPGVVSLNVLQATLGMLEHPDWRRRFESWPEVKFLMLRCAELFPGQPFSSQTIELLMAKFQESGLTPDQARHLPLSEAVRRLPPHQTTGAGVTVRTAIKAAPAPTDTGTRLVLPEPLTDDANPFCVLDWVLFTAYVAARHLTDLRRARVVQLGRKMRTEDRNGVLVLHYADDVDWRTVEIQLSELIDNRWWKAQSDARKLCAGHCIPFDVYDPLLKAAWEKMGETRNIIHGVACDKEVYPDNKLNGRLHELADSTRLAITPPTEATQTEGGTQENNRPKGIPLAEAEILVRDWLLKYAKDNPTGITRDAVAVGTGVSAGQVSKTAAWKVFRDRRDAEASPKARVIPLTDAMQAVVPGDCETPDELAALIEEQKAEENEEHRRHKRRHRPS